MNKIKVASFLKEKTGYVVNADAMFDVQVLKLFMFFVYLECKKQTLRALVSV